VRDIAVKVVTAPGEVRCGERFKIEVVVKNWTDRAMQLSLREEQPKVETVLLDGW
jgi:hypothetical protein